MEEQQLLMLFETNATLETQKFNNTNKKQALVEVEDRTSRLYDLNSKLYHLTELMNPPKQKCIKPPAPPSACDLNKSRYAPSDLPNKKKTKKLPSDDSCLPSKNDPKKEQSSQLGTKKNGLETKPEGDSMNSNSSELESDPQSSLISDPSQTSELRSSSSSFPSSQRSSDDKSSQTTNQDETMYYSNCVSCFSGNANRLPIKGVGFGFMGTGLDYQVSDKPKIEVDICPPLEIIQPTFNDFYEVDSDWLEESAKCPYEDLLPEEDLVEEEPSIIVDPCEHAELMTEWERCLAGCCGDEPCDENESQEYDYNCDEEYTVCNEDDCGDL